MMYSPKVGGRQKKKTWTILLRLRFGGIAKHHCIHIRAKAHAIGVSVLLLLLNASLIFGEISETRI